MNQDPQRYECEVKGFGLADVLEAIREIQPEDAELVQPLMRELRKVKCNSQTRFRVVIEEIVG